MCRLMALTFTDYEHIKLDVLDRLLFMSQTDNGQNDGWGVSDGMKMVKSGKPYSLCVPHWRNVIDPTRTLLAHIRKASSFTGRTDQEAHPYHFEVNGKDLYCAHNGYMHGTYTNSNALNDCAAPNTDSYRCFSDLAKRLQQGSGLTCDVLNKWLNLYEDRSEFAMLIYYDQLLYAIRHDRTLFAMAVGNGYAIHTNDKLLQVLSEYLKECHSCNTGKIIELEKDTVTIFTPGTREITQVSLCLNLVKKPAVLLPIAAYNTHTTNNRLVANPNAVKTYYSPCVTQKRIATTPNEVVSHRKAFGDRNKWKKIVRDLNPMRAELVKYWACVFLGYKKGNDIIDYVSKITEDDIAMFRKFIMPTDASQPVFDAKQNKLINSWNHITKKCTPGIELQLLSAFDTLFWQDTIYSEALTNVEADCILIQSLEWFIANNPIYADYLRL